MKRTAILTRSAAMLLLLSMMLTVLTGCVKKTPVTTADFMAKAGESGLQCVDVKEQFADYDFIQEATIAAASDLSYQLEFYVFTDSSQARSSQARSSQARSFYTNNRTNFDMNKGNVYTDTSKEGANYARYALNAGDRYMFVAYVENTVLYVDTDKTHKDDVNAIIDALKY
ncbi:MAG: hypothetical protein IIY93_00390 [Clostridia bacterium]|nr:hypothetical protein [Clostridia bacterium]